MIDGAAAQSNWTMVRDLARVVLDSDPSNVRASDLLAAAEQALGPPATSSEQTPIPPASASPKGVEPVLDTSTEVGDWFVGRQRELDLLKATFDDVQSGRGRLVMLAGEAGIGKTRTAEELATYAASRGALALWGRCYDDQGMLPYWPWVQVIRSYVQDRDPEGLRSVMGVGASDIAEIVPDLRERLPDLDRPSTLESLEQARFRLFDSIATFLKGASRQQPLVLVLDDLQWADKSSLLLLQFLQRELDQGRLLLVGAYRDGELSRRHPLAETLGELTRGPRFQRVQLRGLDQLDVQGFFKGAACVTLPEALLNTVYHETEGNPFFITEMVRLLIQEGELTSQPSSAWESGSIRIPEGVQEVIGRRLNRLSQECNQVLTVASVIGGRFSKDLLDLVLDEPLKERLPDLLEEALEARVVEESREGAFQLQFTHAMVKETLQGELPLFRRARWHARIGEALEARYGEAEAKRHARELAHHFGQAVAVAGAEKFARYSLLAGEQALTKRAYEDALDYFQRALSAKEGQGQTLSTGLEQEIDDDGAALRFGLGRAQVATSQRVEMELAVDNLRRAFKYYVSAGDVTNAMAVAESPFNPGVGNPVWMAEYINPLLDMVKEQNGDNSESECILLSRWGDFLGMGLRVEDDAQSNSTSARDRYRLAQEKFNRALNIARLRGDTRLAIRTLAWKARVDRFHLYLEQSLEANLEALRLADALGDSGEAPSEEVVMAGFYAALTLASSGRPNEARRYAEALPGLAAKLSDRFWQPTAFWGNETLARLKGDWKAARAHSDRGLALAPKDLRLLHTRTLLEYEAGDAVQGKTYLASLLEAVKLTKPGPTLANTYPALVIPLVARMTGRIEGLDEAESAARVVLSSPSVTPMVERMARTGLALQAALEGNIQEAEKQYQEFRAYTDQLGPSAQRMMVGGIVNSDRALGLLAQAAGRLGEAMDRFERALAFCREAGYRPELAWTCCDYADALVQASHPGDRDKAGALLDESLKIAEDLGMGLLAEKVRAFQALSEQPETPTPYPDGLTQREVEVLRLIAQGKRNREIADDLFIALRTVGNHVGNILAKTNTPNRTAAGRYADEKGLTQRGDSDGN